jgi:hypothetical protein
MSALRSHADLQKLNERQSLIPRRRGGVFERADLSSNRQPGKPAAGVRPFGSDHICLGNSIGTVTILEFLHVVFPLISERDPNLVAI